MSGSGNGHPQERLSEYLDDQLSVEERAAIDRHLASCEECRGSLYAMRRLSRAMAEENVPPLPAELNEKIARRLDEATLLRPARWRFAVPATIAATIAAIGILVAVQWREGRLAPRSVREEARQSQPDDKKTDDRARRARPAGPPPPALPAPSLPPLRDEGVAREERTDLDAAGAAAEKEAKVQGARERDFRTVVGGLASGPEGETEAEEITGGAHENRERASRAPQSQAVDDQASSDRVLFQKQASAAPTPRPAPPLAAKAEVAQSCADRWSDSGARGTWEVADPVAAAHELDTIVLDLGGTGLWRGIDDGRPYQLIVPRSRYLEVFYALRARGIAGLEDPPALDDGDDCTALSITIVHAR